MSSSTSSSNIVTPRAFVSSLVGENVLVKLKWGMEYKGILRCADMYLNLQLENAEEFIDGEKLNDLEEMIIRCNNVLSISKRDISETPGAAGGEKTSVTEVRGGGS